jgi:hypothetical protein
LFRWGFSHVFTTDHFRGEYCRALRTAPSSDYRGWNTNDTVAGNDYAILRLYDPIGSWLGWMGTKTYDSGWNGGNY